MIIWGAMDGFNVTLAASPEVIAVIFLLALDCVIRFGILIVEWRRLNGEQVLNEQIQLISLRQTLNEDSKVRSDSKHTDDSEYCFCLVINGIYFGCFSASYIPLSFLAKFMSTIYDGAHLTSYKLILFLHNRIAWSGFGFIVN